jgi:CRISPR-associated protein Csy3
MEREMKLHSNMLAYARSVQTGDGYFFGLKAGHEPFGADATLDRSALVPAEVQEISVRGTIGNYMKEAAFGKQNIEQANLQTIDRATLPAGCDRLAVKIGVQFLANALSPHAADCPEVIANLRNLVSAYAHKGGFAFLARRYLWNLLNARWLWRNYFVMSDKTVHVLQDGVVRLSVDPTQIERFAYPGDAAMEQACPRFAALAEEIGAAMATPDAMLALEVVAVGHMPEGSEVFPSQEFISGDRAKEVQRRRGSENGPGKVLSAIEVNSGGRKVRQATFHPQKVGNAVRCIDEWHGAEDYGAVAVDPYAAQTTRAVALRPPRHGSLYDFLATKKRAEQLAATVADQTPDAPAFQDAHFVVANLVRGGVFGGKD